MIVCEVHKTHSPEPTYFEFHHILPRAWQGFWQPATAPNPGSWHGEDLWDARGINLCRTGHGNVHYWLTRITHSLQYLSDQGAAFGDVSAAVRIVKGHAVTRPGNHEFAIALEAISRFAEAGGNLAALLDAGLWGEI